MNGNLVDDEYEQNSGNIIENRLLWPALQRSDLYSVFTCHAENTKAVAPREKRLVLDMYRKWFCFFMLTPVAPKRSKKYNNRSFCLACIPAHLMTLTTSSSFCYSSFALPFVRRHPINTPTFIFSSCPFPLTKTFFFGKKITKCLVKPIHVNILNSSLTLVADRKYEIHCVTSGSRPDAIITWLKGKKSLKRIRDYSKNNQTTSILNFVPSIEDNGKTLTCHAENPNVAGMFIEDNWNMSVFCKFAAWTVPWINRRIKCWSINEPTRNLHFSNRSACHKSPAGIETPR